MPLNDDKNQIKDIEEVAEQDEQSELEEMSNNNNTDVKPRKFLRESS